jgi:hypothetical protein
MVLPKTRGWPPKVARRIRVSKKLDEVFMEFVESRHSGALDGYSTEVENAMMLEMTRWNYIPCDERVLLKIVAEDFKPSKGSLEEAVSRVVRVNSALDAAFKSFVSLTYSGMTKYYSLAVQNGMFLLIILSNFASVGEFVD